jgi:hypothetical protein
MKKKFSVFRCGTGVLFTVLLLILLASCCSGAQAKTYANAQSNGKEAPFSIGDTCSYRQFKGSARILAVRWLNKNKAEITFSFSLFDAAQAADYRFPHMGDKGRKKLITIEPNKYDTIRSQLQAGDVISCTRNEIITGTCTPVVFTFTDLEL